MTSSAASIELENQHSAKNYNPLPVVLSKAKGSLMWDPEGKQYYDFLSAYSAVNQGTHARRETSHDTCTVPHTRSPSSEAEPRAVRASDLC